MEAEDKLVREMLNHGGTRVWVTDDVEEWRLDLLHLRERRLSYAERRLKWGKLKMAVLIAIGGSIVAAAGPIISPIILEAIRRMLHVQ